MYTVPKLALVAILPKYSVPMLAFAYISYAPTLASKSLTCVYTVPKLALVLILPRYNTPILASIAGSVVSIITPTLASNVLT